MLDKETAKYIWFCIENHEGYASNFSEWCEYLDINVKDVGFFESMVDDMIEALPEKYI